MTFGASDTAHTAAGIEAAVGAWLELLGPAERERATYPFDTDERFAWDYRPGTRNGVALRDMGGSQRAAALSIVDAAMSDRGAAEIRAVIELETTLGELERQTGRGGINRDPGLYWFAVFGDPAGAAPWSWRVGGHHVAVQTTLVGGGVVGSAPSFLGSNPATVPSGPLAGRRAIDGEERLARALLDSMAADQRRVAVVDPVAPPDILSGNGRRADLGGVPVGIRHDELDPAQQAALEGLIRHYLGRARPSIEAQEWHRIRAAGLAPVTFAWAGPDAPGRGHYYAIRGPNLLIEYDNTQNGANHIHSVWRDPANDWGSDLLADHYRQAHPHG